jgi:hypothetical protein
LRVTNRGLIAAQGSAGLSFNNVVAAGAFDNAGGVIEIRDGSFANFVAGSIEGGTLRGQVTSQLRGSVGATLDGVTLEGKLALVNNHGLGLAGVSENNGTLTLASTGFFTDLRINADATVNGSGSILLSNNGNNRIYGSGGTRLTLGSGQSIVGGGQLGLNLLDMTNQGTIVADGSAGLRLQFANTAVSFINTGGVLEVRDGAFMAFDSGRYEGGTLLGIGSNAALQGSLDALLVDMTIMGNLTLRNNQALSMSGNMLNQAQFAMASTGFFTDLRMTTDTTLGGSGSIVMSNNSNNRI